MLYWGWLIFKKLIMSIKKRVSVGHKGHDQLHQELQAAKKKVKIGGIYSHYKYPENTYQVFSLAFIEATDEVCVVYSANYDPELIFVRPLKSWLETVPWEGRTVPRFTLVK